MRFSLSSSHALLEVKCDMQISYEIVSNAHVQQLTVFFNIHIFDYPDPRLSRLFCVVLTSPDNRGSTVNSNNVRFFVKDMG